MFRARSLYPIVFALAVGCNGNVTVGGALPGDMPTATTNDAGAGTVDLTAPNDFARVAPDIAIMPDFAVVNDLAAAPDMATLPDFASVPDLATLPDLAQKPDMASACPLGPPEYFFVDGDATAVKVGDVTGDGQNDIVVAASKGWNPGHSIAVFAGSQGALLPVVSYAIPQAYTNTYTTDSLDLADLNNDGKLDVVVDVKDGFLVYLQENGKLGSPWYYPSMHTSFSNPYLVQAGDVSGDGLADVVSIDWGTQSIEVDVSLQNMQGKLNPPLTFESNHGGWDDLRLADADGDGKKDIIIMSGQPFAIPNVGVNLQIGGGMFEPTVYYRIPGMVNTKAVAVGDVDGDNWPDMVVTYGGNTPRSFIGIFDGDGLRGFKPAVSYPSADIPSSVAITDMDQDGLNDIIVLHDGWHRVGVYAHNANRQLMPELTCPTAYGNGNPEAMTVGDVNSDGKPDVVHTDTMTGRVAVLKNNF